MKKILLLLSSIFVLGGSVTYAQTNLGITTQAQVEEKTIEEMDKSITSDNFEYNFIYRGYDEFTHQGMDKGIYMWLVELTNITDELQWPIFDIYQDFSANFEDEMSVKEVDLLVSRQEYVDGNYVKDKDFEPKVQYKPGITDTFMFSVEFELDKSNDEDSYFLEYKNDLLIDSYSKDQR